MKKKKRASGGAQLKAQGKVGVLVGVPPDELAKIDAARKFTGASRAGFILATAAEEAKNILNKKGK